VVLARHAGEAWVAVVVSIAADAGAQLLLFPPVGTFTIAILRTGRAVHVRQRRIIASKLSAAVQDGRGAWRAATK